MANEKKLTLKLSLKKETLRELNDSQLDTLDQVVGGTGCACTYIEARTAADPCDTTVISGQTIY